MSPSSETYRIELSNTAVKAVKNLGEKDRDRVLEILKAIQADPFDRALTCKLKGEWEGCRRARKGNWRVVYYPPREKVIYVIYIRYREEKTYRKG